MSALIRVMLSSPSAQLRPGEWVELTLTVQNFGEVVDRYQVTVEGIAPSWVALSRNELSLFPKDQDQVRITIRTPAGAEARAGRYDVRIHVTSLETPSERSTVAFALEIQGQVGLDVALNPPRQSGAAPGVFDLSVGNPGNADLTVFLSAMDAEGRCFYTFEPAQLSVPAGQSGQARLTVQPVAAMPGKGPHTIPFTIMAQPAEAPNLARQVEGQWEMRQKQFPRWLIWLLVGAGVLLVLGALAAVLIFVVLPRLQMPVPTAVVATSMPVAPTEGVAPIVPTTALPAAPTVPTAIPSPEPTEATEPTPDLWAEMRAVIDNYNTVRAQAETNLDPELMRQVAVNPELDAKMGRIQRNKDEGSHWETVAVVFTINSVDAVRPDDVEVRLTKTETKLFYYKGSALPDDETCTGGTILSYRNCTYDVIYKLVKQNGIWYVYEGTPIGDCVSKCQH